MGANESVPSRMPRALGLPDFKSLHCPFYVAGRMATRELHHGAVPNHAMCSWVDHAFCALQGVVYIASG